MAALWIKNKAAEYLQSIHRFAVLPYPNLLTITKNLSDLLFLYYKSVANWFEDSIIGFYFIQGLDPAGDHVGERIDLWV